MKKAKHFLPAFIVSILFTMILAVAYLGNFMAESKANMAEKENTILSYVRSTMDTRSETLRTRVQSRQSKNMASVITLGEILESQYDFSALKLNGNELENGTKELSKDAMLLLVVVDRQGNIWENTEAFPLFESDGEKLNLKEKFSLSDQEWEEILSSSYSKEDNTAFLSYTPKVVSYCYTEYGQDDPVSFDLYPYRLDGGRYYLIGVESSAMASFSSYALQSTSFVNNLDDDIIILSVDLDTQTIENTTDFDSYLYAASESDAEGEELPPNPLVSLGLTDEMLTDGYEGELTIDGTSYSVKTITYSNDVFTKNRAFVALAPNGYYDDYSFAYYAVLIFFVVILLFLIYLLFVKEELNTVLISEQFKWILGKKLYFRQAMFKRLYPAVIISIVAVLIASFSTTTLSMCSTSMSKLHSRHQSVTEELSSNFTLQYISDEMVKYDYAQQARTVAMAIRSNPEAMLHSDSEEAPFYTLSEEGYRVRRKDYAGNEITCRLACEGLQKLAYRFNFLSATIYSLDGLPIASSGESLPEEIAEGSELHNVLMRKATNAMITIDDRVQFAIPISLYTKTNEIGDLEYITCQEYEQQKGTSGFSEKDCILVLTESTLASGTTVTEEYATNLLEEDTISGSSYLLYANDENHTLLFSPSILSGLDSSAIALPEEALEGEYYGFVHLGGTRYLIHSRKIEIEGLYGTDASNYWLVAMLDSNIVYRYRMVTILYVLQMVAIYLGVLVAFQTIYTKKKYNKLAREFSNETFSNEALPDETISSDSMRATNAAQKMKSILRVLLMGVFLAFVFIFLLYWRKSSTPSVMRWIAGYTWPMGINIFSVTCVCFLLIGAFSIGYIVSRTVNLLGSVSSSRMNTVIKLMTSIIRYAIVLFVIFYGLYLFGMDTSSVLTSFGLFSALVGLGANKLIADIVAGIFIILEGEFQVGDIVTIGNFCGKVTEIGVRTTKVENMDGNINIYTNSSITTVMNMTFNSSRVKLDLQVNKSIPSDQVEALLKKVLPEISRKCSIRHEELAFMGIDQINGANHVYRVESRCNELVRNALYRYLNKELLQAFKENNIPLA